LEPLSLRVSNFSAARAQYICSSVIQVASSSQRKPIVPTLWASLKPFLRSPLQYLALRTTRLLFTVYFGTYTTANALDSLHDSLQRNADAPVSPATVKLVGVSAVSTSLTVYKDSRFTQIFGAAVRPQPVPPISYLLFTFRDVLTIYGCFVLPPTLAERLDHLPAHFKTVLPLSTPETRARVSQLLLPVMVQFISTPIHLLALDLYNRQQRGLGASQRLARVFRDLPSAVPTRMLRILPAFGVGGVLNTEVRGAMLRKFGYGHDCVSQL
jgi:hypothetical protein